MCTSLTGALTTTGVSTSSTPRAAKNSRVHARSAARRSRSAREALGRQSPPPLTSASREPGERLAHPHAAAGGERAQPLAPARSEEHTSELQSRLHLVCRLLLEKKKTISSLSILSIYYLVFLTLRS